MSNTGYKGGALFFGGSGDSCGFGIYECVFGSKHVAISVTKFRNKTLFIISMIHDRATVIAGEGYRSQIRMI